MSLQFHNQLTKAIDTFHPLRPGKVSLYTCGPTVYHYPTVGNWAAYIYWDTLVRVLQANGYEVTRVMNITDVGHLVSDEDEGEDKLEKGARREGKTAWEIAHFYTEDFIRGMKLLNVLPPHFMPKATDYIEEQLALVKKLKDAGFTYEIEDGIYYDTSQFPSYGAFAGLDLAGQQAGARVEAHPDKRNASDFALWKFTPSGQVRDMQWETPASLTEGNVSRMGFPGWHLECSAMAMALLGETIDIHTGGIDHIPVHHTNEIAQSEAITGKPLAHYWLHNNHLKVDGTKMSKSLGNAYTLQDIQNNGYDPLDLRLFVLQSHYQSEGNFTYKGLTAAARRRLHWRNVAALRHQSHDTLVADSITDSDSKTVSLYAASQALTEALSDNLDTVSALTIIEEAFDLIVNTPLEDIHEHAFISFLETVDALFGLRLLETTPDISDDQKRLIIERLRAREHNDFEKADHIRSELEKGGVSLRDTAFGTVWHYTSVI